MALFSLPVERHVLGGLIKRPEIFFEVGQFISEHDFYNDIHNVIYCTIRNFSVKGEKFDKVLLAEKIKNLGISFKDEINIYDYIDSLSFTQITPQATLQACQELVRLRVFRELEETADKMKASVKAAGDKGVDQVIAEIDSLYGSKISSYDFNDEPENIFEGLQDLVEERGENPIEETGYQTPHPEFNRMFGGLRGGNIYAIVSRPGQGKALEENTPIPVPTGWKSIKDLVVGDEVFAVDGTITKVVGVKKWENRPIYKVKMEDDEILADENHEWFVQRRWDYKWEVRDTKFLATNLLEKRPRLPIGKPLELPERSLPIDPYILGLWLGDGTSAKPDITTADEYILKKWKDYGRSLGLKVRYNGNYGYAFTTRTHSKPKNAFLTLLRENNLLDNKHVPEAYFRASKQQRLALLQGLIDSDGHVDPADGHIEFCNKNVNLALAVAELVRSFGIKATVNRNKSTLYGKICADRWRVKFLFHNAALLPRKRKATKKAEYKNPHRHMSITPFGKGNTVCIEIEHPSHLFLCGKSMVPTHNSSYLNDVSFGASKISNFKVKTLILDTEMFTVDIRFRRVAALTGVPVWHLETGNWRKNPDMLKKVRDAWKLIKNYEQFHYQVGNKNIDQICSIIRRWYYSKVGRGNPAIICYDYIKLTGEKVGQNWAEHQAIGDKVDKLKKISEELKVPIFTAMQMNRSGENFNRKSADVTDDSSAIALSDRLQWYGSFVAIFRRKTVDEITLDGEKFGTHKMIPVKTRFQGRDAAGHQDLVKRIMEDGEEKWTTNYLNFDVQNFAVNEKGSLKDVVAEASLKYTLQDKKKEGELL
jgi:replicative DNA helicase